MLQRTLSWKHVGVLLASIFLFRRTHFGCGFCTDSYLQSALPSLGSVRRVGGYQRGHQRKPLSRWRNDALSLDMASPSSSSAREEEIKRKIMDLKKAGKISGSEKVKKEGPSYGDLIAQKLGKRKSRMLGFEGETTSSTEIDYEDEEEDEDIASIRRELDDEEQEAVEESSAETRGRIGAIPELQSQKEQMAQDTIEKASNVSADDPVERSTTNVDETKDRTPIINPDLFEETEPTEPELSEEELLEIVAEKMAAKRVQEALEREARDAERAKILRAQRAKKEAERAAREAELDAKEAEDAPIEDQQQLTSGVGGKWIKNDDANKTKADYYQPKSGSWGAFPRPKDISKAYGGGRRVGPGFSEEDDGESVARTKDLLKGYRKKVGIDVASEKEHAAEIDEALAIGQKAMQRGMYASGVSALEKVTKWCSTNSKVGSKVYLELAMAYEAVGQTKEAIKVYQTLTECRMDDVKSNAKRLLYGLEAMELMKGVSSDFTRTKVKNTFVEVTGLRDIAQNFDDVYNTAYVDLDKGFYKTLTESVVRSAREARQILLKATGRGEVGRTSVVQALRMISRSFDEALEMELTSQSTEEPVAYINGQPLVVTSESVGRGEAIDGFALASSIQMLDNLNGKWALQLLADKRGDGVSFYNTSSAFQEFDTDSMTFTATGPSGWATVNSSGELDADKSKRILKRANVQTPGGGGGILGMFAKKDAGFVAAVSREQQIMSVDSILLITRNPFGTRKGNDAEKEHFGVWRRVFT